MAPKVEELEALQLETRYFLDCVKDGTQPFNDGQAGLRVVRILEAGGTVPQATHRSGVRLGSGDGIQKILAAEPMLSGEIIESASVQLEEVSCRRLMKGKG